MDALEHEFLLIQGFVPANVQACRDFMAGKITQAEMWKVIHQNIDLSRFMELEGRKQEKPRPKDLVKRHEEFGRIVWIDYEGEVVNVEFFVSKDVDELRLDEFYNYSSKGGRTTWLLD